MDQPQSIRRASRMRNKVEWPTLGLIIFSYLFWALATTVLSAFWLPLGIVATSLLLAMFSSLHHEVLHGHPFRNKFLNEALVFPSLGMIIPYARFRDTHLDHHHDAELTDPYDDPESNYLDPYVWDRLPRALQILLTINNTLLGRFFLGVLVSQYAFVASDLRAIQDGDRRVLRGWLVHIPALVPVTLWLILVAQMPVWAYLVAVYVGHSIIKIRTFLEHQAAERASGRTAIVEDGGLLAFLFLNNNLHVVHHMHPRVPWYRLPKLYRDNRAHYAKRNGGYVIRSYAEVARKYLLRTKDPVPHPLWR